MTVSTTAPDGAGRTPLGVRAIAAFLGPLVLNAWLVTLVGPLLDAALGRAAEPRVHLAAFWLAFGVLLVCQSPCLVLQQVTAAARRRGEPLSAIALGALLLGAAATVLVLAVARTPLGDAVFRDVIPTPAHTAALARATLVPMALLPLLVSLRGLAGGVAVTARRTGLLASATLLRVLVLGGVATAIVVLHAGGSAVSAAWMLVATTAAESVFVTLAAGLRPRAPDAAAPARVRAAGIAPIVRLALPLAAASLAWTAARPLVGAVLGRLADPVLAQAAFGVVLPILFVSCGPLWAFLDVVLVLPHGPGDVRRVVRVAALASAGFAAAIVAMTWTPLGGLVLHRAFALPRDLEHVVRPALALLVLEPALLSARAIGQGLLLRAGRGGLLLALAPLKLAAMLGAGLLVAARAPHANGAVLALALFLGGDLVDAVLFAVAVRRTGAAAVAKPVRGEAAPPPASDAGPLQEAA